MVLVDVKLDKNFNMVKQLWKKNRLLVNYLRIYLT